LLLGSEGPPPLLLQASQIAMFGLGEPVIFFVSYPSDKRKGIVVTKLRQHTVLRYAQDLEGTETHEVAVGGKVIQDKATFNCLRHWVSLAARIGPMWTATPRSRERREQRKRGAVTTSSSSSGSDPPPEPEPSLARASR
jgi:hypothetical protein